MQKQYQCQYDQKSDQHEVQVNCRKECGSSLSASTSRKISRTRYKQVAKRCPGEGPIFGPPLCQIRAPGFRVSAAWRPGFGYVLAAVSGAVLVGSRYESGKLVPAMATMVPVAPRGLSLVGVGISSSGSGFYG